MSLNSKYSSKYLSLPPISLSNKTIVFPINFFSTRHCYEIVNKQQTASAFLLFAQHRDTEEHVVIKILRRYQDTRYNLKTTEKRLQYQLEALHWNKRFAPRVYIGLADIHDWGFHKKTIILSEIIENPIKERLDPNAEYALVMHELPTARRLDILLKDKDENRLQRHIRLLTEYVAYMHTDLLEPPLPNGNNIIWGSFEQIQKKLKDNLALLDLVVTASENAHYSSINLLQNTLSPLLRHSSRRSLEQSEKSYRGDLNVSNKLREILNRLKKNLLEVFSKNPYQEYFNQRIREQRIKRCHGDLKAPHIWIAPYSPCFRGEAWKYVCVLDTIDFNPTFYNIDVLSDLAMLIIDIQARTKSYELAKIMEEYYLKRTGQQDKASRLVLNYYLVEKAIMWAAVSIVYDNLPELGLTFLGIAEQRMKDLMDGDLIWRADTLIDIPPITSLFAYHSK